MLYKRNISKTVVLNPCGMKTVELIEITAEPIKPTTAGFNPDIHPFMTILFEIE